MMAWLNNFKTKLANDSGYSNQPKEILLQKDDCFYKVNWPSELTKIRYPKVDALLSTKYEFHDIVIDSKKLKEYGYDYHLVLLDATEDYVLNKYPKNESPHQSGTLSNVDEQIQCAIFVNNDGTYFLALPVEIDLYEPISHKVQIPVVETDLKTISKILDHFDLTKDTMYYSDKLIHKLHLYNDGKGLSYFQTNKSGFSNCILALEDSYLSVVRGYLKSHLKIKLLDDGHFNIALHPTNEFWTKRLSKFTMLNIIRANSSQYNGVVRDPLFTCSFDEFIGSIVVQSWELISQATITKYPLEITTKKWHADSTNSFKPLTKANGLSNVFALMSDSDQQKCFWTGDNFITLHDNSMRSFPKLDDQITEYNRKHKTEWR